MRQPRHASPAGLLRLAGCALAVWLVFAIGVGAFAAVTLRHAWAAWAIPILVGLFLAFAMRVMRRLWLAGPPLTALADAARKIEGGDYSARVSAQGPPWLRSMARAFNSMSEQLEAADRRRRGFLADLAHELRTPLAVVRAQAEAINEGVHPADEEHLGAILDATRTMEALVADLRTLAESEAGALTLKREPVDLAELIAEVAAPHGDAVKVAAPPGMPAADADPDRIRRVLENLVANALAHSSASAPVRVHLAAAGRDLEVTVSDEGEGMPPELAGRAFERFVRGPGSRGSGLGLAIAKDVVEAHGGSISLESRQGQGTRVRFTLPAVE